MINKFKRSTGKSVSLSVEWLIYLCSGVVEKLSQVDSNLNFYGYLKNNNKTHRKVVRNLEKRREEQSHNS